ncbi:MAG: ABC transporter ATP-binding protein [Acidobacteria bacterium]|nr:ABC transporter ATP-binding protein [Acidobacteriota bacterium]
MTPDLLYHGVSRYFGSRAAVRDLTLRCPSGGATCLIGPNGAGKSTALAMAAGLLPPSSGVIRHGQHEVHPLVPSHSTAYLPQHSAFPSVLTVREIMEFARAARRSKPAEWEEIIEVTGLGPAMSLRVGELSGGWTRRLGLASALIPPASLLLLDEPFVGLDPETLDRLVEHLRKRAEAGSVVVLSSHDFEVVDLLEPQVAVLEESKLRAVHQPGAVPSRILYRETLTKADFPEERRLVRVS